MANLKKIGEVFSDYKTNSNLKYAQITSLNVVKKTNTLEVDLYFDEYLDIKEIWFFEKFLRERFQFENIDIKIKYHESVKKKSIKEEWRNIIAYMSHKYPLTKPMLLLKSDVEENGNNILIKMHIKGADFLRAKKTDKELIKVLENLFGIKYTVELTEEITKDSLEEIKRRIEEEQANIVAHMEEEQKAIAQEKSEHNTNASDENYPPMPPPPDIDGYILEEMDMPPIEEPPIPEDYIMGKPSKAKEKHIKIKDISANDGRVTLEGRVTTSDVRETKSGKGMIIFEIYDGTGLITVKSFAKDLKEGQEIIEKIQEAKTVKAIGKAGLDTYAGDITVIANTIAKSNIEVPELPEERDDTPIILGNTENITEPLVKVQDLGVDDGKVALQGEVIYSEDRTLKSGKTLFSFDLYDGTSTITCKAFLNKDSAKRIMKRIKGAKGIKVAGTAGMDSFTNELSVMVNNIVEAEGIKKTVRKDNSEVKRVELHMHTQMSQMDAMTSAKDLIKRAMSWGMKSIAITDHGVVQAFPEAHKMLGYDNPDMKILYGVEAYLAPDKNPVVENGKGQYLEDVTYYVLDLETTGFSAVTEKITEIGIMKVKDGEVLDEFSCFVNPEKHIPQRVTEVTNITDEMVADAETIEKVFPKMLEFIGNDKNAVLVAHNAGFDIGFLKQNAKVLGYDFDYTYLDTLSLAKDLFPEYKKYKLGKIADNLGIKVEVAHRALDDVDTTVKVFKVMLDMLDKRGAKKIEDIDQVSRTEEAKKEEYKKLKTYHAIILAKNYVGLRNLYKLVSLSHLHYFYRKPRILKSLFEKYREGLILGSACEAGELYQAIELGKSDEEIEEIAEFYDYLEIQPIGNNNFLIRKEIIKDEEGLRDINRKIVKLGEKLNKTVVATCDVHFMDPQDEVYRRILEAGQGYDDADMQAPLYLRTTSYAFSSPKYANSSSISSVVLKYNGACISASS